MSYILFVLIGACANKIRGGLLQHLYRNTLMWKILTALLMSVSSYFLLEQDILTSGTIGAGWFLFLLPKWGRWFDIGQVSGTVLRDSLMMFLRGLLSILLMAPLAYLKWDASILLLTFPLSILWTLCYVVDRAWIKPFKNYAEYYAGAVIALFIILGVQI